MYRSASCCAWAGSSASIQRSTAPGRPPYTGIISVQRPTSSSATVEKIGLTVRELEVVRLIAQGHSNTEIAAELFVSDATVKTHINHIFSNWVLVIGRKLSSRHASWVWREHKDQKLAFGK